MSDIAIAPTAIATQHAAVVQNDAANEPKLTGFALLEAERVTWEQGVYRTSNLALYALLAKCYALATLDDKDLVKKRNAELEAFYKERGYQYKKDAPPASRIVKAVFGGVDRRRLCTYSLVLRAAQKASVQSSDLAQWIEDEGGIQEIKLKQSPNYVKPADKAKHANTQLSALPSLANVKTEALSKFADGEHMYETCVLIAEQNADGSFDIKAVVRSGAALTAALGTVYSEHKKAAQGK